MRRRCFTLLEIVIGIALLAFASGTVIWKTQSAIAKKKFDTDVSRMQMQLEACYHLALNTHADWKVQAIREGNHFIVQTSCVNEKIFASFQPKKISLDSCKLFFEGEETDLLVIYFSPTGKIIPTGVLQLVHLSSDSHRELQIPELLRRKEIPVKKGPTHPDDG